MASKTTAKVATKKPVTPAKASKAAKPVKPRKAETAAKAAPAPKPTKASKSATAGHPADAAKPATRSTGPVLRSIRSAIYKVDDLERARTFYAAALDRQPYFDQPFYVGFDVDGQELGLDPDVSQVRPGPGGAVAYWRIDDLHATVNYLLALGGSVVEPAKDVGGGITTGIIADPFGNLVGLIQGA